MCSCPVWLGLFLFFSCSTLAALLSSCLMICCLVCVDLSVCSDMFMSKMGKELALSTFKANRKSYHGIAQKMVAKDLEIKE